jgi:hypothetical protein
MQLSRSEPAIRHAVNAISYAAKSALNGNLKRHSDPRVLKESNQAIRCVAEAMEKSPSSRLVPLVICLLFTCLEFIHGTIDSAIVHSRSGFKIMESTHQFLEDAHERDTIVRHVEPVFERLEILWKLFGHRLDATKAFIEPHNLPFQCLQDVQSALVDFLSLSIGFVHISGAKIQEGTVQVDDLLEQYRLQQMAVAWEEKFEKFLAKKSEDELNDMKITASIFRMQAKAMKIWLALCLSIEESVSDLHNAEYAKIVGLGEEVIANQSSKSPVRQDMCADDDVWMSFDMQVIAPLYLTALKCRVPSVRRKAVLLISQGPRREGLWDAHTACKMAETIIDAEEENMRRHYGEAVDLNDMLPPEQDRIDNICELPGVFEACIGGKITQKFSYRVLGLSSDRQYIEKVLIL